MPTSPCINILSNIIVFKRILLTFSSINLSTSSIKIFSFYNIWSIPSINYEKSIIPWYTSFFTVGNSSWINFWYSSIQFLSITVFLPIGAPQIFFYLKKNIQKVLQIEDELNHSYSSDASILLKEGLNSEELSLHYHIFIFIVLQRKVFDSLFKYFFFEYVWLVQELIGHFGISMISVSKLKSIDWTFNVIFSRSMIANQSVWWDVFVHSKSYNI